MKYVTMLFFLFLINGKSTCMCGLEDLMGKEPVALYEPEFIQELKSKRRKLETELECENQWKVEDDKRIESIYDKVMCAQFDGYSPIGAVFTGKLYTVRSSSPIKEMFPSFLRSSNSRLESISHLLKIGVKPTEKDQWLAYLELYERTLDDSKRKLTLLLLYTNPDLPLLPPECILYIASFITHNEEPLIPRHLCTACKMIKKLEFVLR